MTYPDGEMVTHNYNNRMLLNSLIGTRTEAHAELIDELFKPGTNSGVAIAIQKGTFKSSGIQVIQETIC